MDNNKSMEGMSKFEKAIADSVAEKKDPYLIWLDEKILLCKNKTHQSAKGGEDSLLWHNRMDIYRICKEQYLSLHTK